MSKENYGFKCEMKAFLIMIQASKDFNWAKKKAKELQSKFKNELRLEHREIGENSKCRWRLIKERLIDDYIETECGFDVRLLYLLENNKYCPKCGAEIIQSDRPGCIITYQKEKDNGTKTS